MIIGTSAFEFPAENAMLEVKSNLAEIEGRHSHQSVKALTSEVGSVHEGGGQRGEATVAKLDISQGDRPNSKIARQVGRGTQGLVWLRPQRHASLKEDKTGGAGIDKQANG